MRWTAVTIIGALNLAACNKGEPAPPPPEPPVAKQPVRGAAGDGDLRVMLSDLASSKACSLIRGQFRALRAPDRPGVATGVLWIRGCEISNDGTRVTFHLTGNGWQWADQTKKKAGGTFVVRQYVKFSVDTKIQGSLDIAYDRKAHIVSLWFTPTALPDVGFKTVGDVDVDRKGTWSSIVGALGSAIADSPESVAEDQAATMGKGELKKQLADGLAVTINLCTGLARFNLGRQPKSEMQPADVGETKRVPVEVQPGGVMVAGPQLAGNGMTVHAETSQGAVRMTLVCAEHAEAVAAELLADRVPSVVPVLGSVDVRGKAKLHIKSTRCPVVVVTSPLDNAPATYSWLRLPSEIAGSTGGPLMHCKDATPPARTSTQPTPSGAKPKSERRSRSPRQTIRDAWRSTESVRRSRTREPVGLRQ